MAWEDLIWNGGILLAIVGLTAYGLKKISEVFRARARGRPQGTTDPNNPISNALNRYNSFHEMFTDIAVTAEVALKDMHKNVVAAGGNPEAEQSYQHLVKRREQAIKIVEQISGSPIIMALDQAAYPAIRDLYPTLITAAKRFTKSLGGVQL